MRAKTIAISLLFVASGSFAIGYLRSSGIREGIVYERTQAALREPSRLRSSLQLATVFESATPEEFDEIVRAVEASQIGEGPGLQTFEMLGELWAQRDPLSAIDRSASWGDYARRQLRLPLLRAWARVDGAAARASSETVAEDALRASAEAEVVLGRFEADAERAWTEYANGWPYGRDALQAVLTRIVYRDGLESLLDRVEDLADPGSGSDSDSEVEEFRVTVSRQVAQIGGRLDPARTARFVEAHADSPVDGLRNLLAPFVLGWVQGDPRAAHDWLMTQPADGRRSAALRRAFRDWALQPMTRDAAIEWLETQPEAARRPVLGLYAQALIDIDPQRAISIAEQIEGPGRDKVVARIRQRVEARERQEAR